MKTTVSTRVQIVLPAENRRDGIAVGRELELSRLTPPRNHGLVDWLLSCPEKDSFVPIDSESTDTL